MSAMRTAGLVYLAAGLTCWAVLAVAYLRLGALHAEGRAAHGLRRALVKTLIALPVVLLWPILVAGLLRREAPARGERRDET